MRKPSTLLSALALSANMRTNLSLLLSSLGRCQSVRKPSTLFRALALSANRIPVCTNLSLPFSLLSGDFSLCVNPRRCSARLPDSANTNLSLAVSRSFLQGGGMLIYSSKVTLTSCSFTSNTAVRSVVQLACLIAQILTSLLLSLFCRSISDCA